MVSTFSDAGISKVLQMKRNHCKSYPYSLRQIKKTGGLSHNRRRTIVREQYKIMTPFL